MITREDFNKQHPIVEDYDAREQENEYQQVKAGEATRGFGVPSREEWNIKHPVTDHYTKCIQGQEYVALYPAGAGKEPLAPKLCERTDLSVDEAVREYKKIQDLPRPEHGWQSWVTTKINWRYDQLRKIVFDHAYHGTTGESVLTCVIPETENLNKEAAAVAMRLITAESSRNPKHPYIDTSHPQHGEFVAVMARLYDIAGGAS